MFGVVGQFGLIPNAPVLGFLFDDDLLGAEWLQLVQSWGSPPYDDDGLSMHFIIDEDSSTYYALLSPESTALIERVLGPDRTEEYEPLLITFPVLKTLPLSDLIIRLRTAATHKPIVLAQALRDGTFNESAAMVIRSVRFSTVDELIPGGLEACMIEQAQEEQPQRRSEARDPPSPSSPQDVRDRRRLQTRRFFPMTLTRLRFNRTYTKAVSQLARTNARWQLDQAACNLVVRRRLW